MLLAQRLCISIHALREEGDVLRTAMCRHASYFYPRPPRGGRHDANHHDSRRSRISIHALREEGDPSRAIRPTRASNFYPRPPRGGRPESVDATVEAIKFLSTPSARRATSLPWPSAPSRGYFYPRPPRGGRPREPNRKGVSTIFLSTPSARRATNIGLLLLGLILNFYPRPPRGGRRTGHAVQLVSEVISIHALREEGDKHPKGCRGSQPQFLSTPSARRATGQL